MDANSSPHRKSHAAAFVSRARASGSSTSPRLNVRSVRHSKSATAENLLQLSRVPGTPFDPVHSRHRRLAVGALVLVGVVAAGVFNAAAGAAVRVGSAAILS